MTTKEFAPQPIRGKETPDPAHNEHTMSPAELGSKVIHGMVMTETPTTNKIPIAGGELPLERELMAQQAAAQEQGSHPLK